MTTEVENDESSEKSKGYYLSSLLIIGIFVGVILLGYILDFLNWFSFITLFVLFFAFTAIIIAYSDRLETVSVEKWGKKFRKYSHLTGGVVMICFCILSPITLAWICLSFFIMFLIHEIFYVKLHISGIYTKTLIFVGRLERKNNESSESPKTFYPTLMVFAAIAIIALLGQMVAIAAVITFAFGDSFSAIVGERFGKYKLPYNKTKSILGTIVFFVTSFIAVAITYFVAGQSPWVPALIAASVGSIVESVIPTNFWLDDNLAVPVSVAIVLFLVQIF